MDGVNFGGSRVQQGVTSSPPFPSLPMTTAGRQPVGLAVAQFEDIVSRGLRALIEEDPHLRLIAADVPPNRLAETFAESAPDVAILNFATLSRPADLRALHTRFPGVRLMVLADNPSSSECRQLIGFGATVCLSKATEARDLLHAIYLASRGLQVLPSTDAQGCETTTGAAPLTPREADVLELLQGGRSNAEIAAALHVGVETVRTHARSIYRKLGVRTRRDLRLMS
jgi:DNA-binding NarL/FixJ family response regulator